MKATMLSLTAGLLSLTSIALSASPPSYVAHEWGTFTSVQAGDGVQIVWNPFNPLELPHFVYDRTKAFGPEMLLLKSNLSAKQRLETPVIYFHSPEAMTVDVSVSFPQGSVTEWYPRATVPKAPKAGIPAIEWKGVKIIPGESRAAQGLAARLPREPLGSHYYAAREAAADYITTGGKEDAEVEKLLFYRGIGNFDAPLMVTLPSSDDGRLLLLNTSTEVLRDLFLIQVQDGTMAITPIDDIAAQSAASAEVGRPQPLGEARKELANKMQFSLVRAGLYESEAAAMVKTWDDSWFAENGTRVLYILPTAWADRVLPLTLTPAPREIARVFVGRAEVLTPTIESYLASEVDRYPLDPATAVTNVRGMGFGRFLEPLCRRLVAQRPNDREYSSKAWELVAAAMARPKPAVITSR